MRDSLGISRSASPAWFLPGVACARPNSERRSGAASFKCTDAGAAETGQASMLIIGGVLSAQALHRGPRLLAAGAMA